MERKDDQDSLQITLTPEQRVGLWTAFANGEPGRAYEGPQDEHWSVGVDRMLLELQRMLWAGDITIEDLGFRFSLEIRVEGGGGSGDGS